MTPEINITDIETDDILWCNSCVDGVDFDEEIVRKLLMGIKVGKAGGPDEVNGFILKKMCLSISKAAVHHI